ncbi:hypothetical protein DV737_g251, partial [Chaetothyriales sp. CBS 132003]
MGAQKATATTTCQKCLQKGHFSYECTSSLQDRPYAWRPSRTQQFNNPKLAPKLTSTKPDEALASNGLAGKTLPDTSRPGAAGAASRRSRSPSSVTSVSTISTNRSQRGGARGGARDARSASQSRDRGRKRRYNSGSSASASRSPSARRQSPSRRKNRRRRFDSPSDRGRPVPRRGSHRSPSRSPSLDERRHRRSLASPIPPSKAPQRLDLPLSSAPAAEGRARVKPRSLSPYSRRLALTQTMNTGR